MLDRNNRYYNIFRLLKSSRGFTLIEVLASLLLITIIIMPLYFQLWQGVKSQQNQDNYLRLFLLAKGHLEQLRGEYEANNRLISLETITGANQGVEDDVNWQINWQLIEGGNHRGLYQIEISYYQLKDEAVNLRVSTTTRLMGEVP